MKKIAENFKGHAKELILGPFFKLLEAVLELLVPLVMANIIDVGIRNKDFAYIAKNGAILVLLALLGAAAAMICQYYAAVCGAHFGQRLRRQVYGHVMSLSPQEVDSVGVGGLITRLTNDTNQMQVGVNMAIRLGTRVPFLAIGSIVMAIVINWKIGLVVLASAVLMALVLYAIMHRTIPMYGDIQHKQDEISRLSQENMDGARVVRAFSRQQDEKKNYSAAAAKLTAVMVKVGRISAGLNPLTTLIVNIGIGLIVWWGAGVAFNGGIAPGEIIALVNYMNQTLLALIVAANLIVIFTRAIASGKRISCLLSIQPAIVDGPGAKQDEAAPAIQFSGVNFAYHKGAENALANINFAIQKGETIGIIGGTGSGKTTMMQLILRNYDTDAGSVFVSGDNVKNYTLGALRGKIGMVPQKASLFSGTIRTNLAVGAPHANEEDMWQALEQAQGAEFVRKLPKGLDAPVEEGGKNFSGGQRQRLTIARALVRKPQILILDDSASALDYATDAALRKALRAETGGMTTLIISQRAATLMQADKILVLENGNLAGADTHKNLLQSCEVYREICASQGILQPQGGVGA